MKATRITDKLLETTGWRQIGTTDTYHRWLIQWNGSQFVTLYQRRDLGTWSVRYRGYYIQGFEFASQLDDAIALLERWGVLKPREDIINN